MAFHLSIDNSPCRCDINHLKIIAEMRAQSAQRVVCLKAVCYIRHLDQPKNSITGSI